MKNNTKPGCCNFSVHFGLRDGFRTHQITLSERTKQKIGGIQKMMFMICEETLGAQIHFIKNKISHELRDFRILVFESEKISRILSFSQKQVYARIVHSMTATYPKESVNGGVTVKVAPKSTTNVIFPFHGTSLS